MTETEVKLERRDLERRVLLPHQTYVNREAGTELIVPPARTPGLHASGLLKYVSQTSGITKYKDELEQDEVPILWALGLMWEEYAVSLWPEIVWQPGEFTDPVIGTCDGISGQDGQIQIEEFKLTVMKKRKPGKELIVSSWSWMMQGRIYCLGYGADTVRWHVCYVSGGGWKNDFGYSPWPQYVQYVVRFSEKELAETRQMIEANRKGAIANGYEE